MKQHHEEIAGGSQDEQRLREFYNGAVECFLAGSAAGSHSLTAPFYRDARELAVKVEVAIIEKELVDVWVWVVDVNLVVIGIAAPKIAKFIKQVTNSSHAADKVIYTA
jgi:hypothetical protein